MKKYQHHIEEILKFDYSNALYRKSQNLDQKLEVLEVETVRSKITGLCQAYMASRYLLLHSLNKVVKDFLNSTTDTQI